MTEKKVYAVGVPCEGMADISKIKERADGIASISEESGKINVETLYDGTVSIDRGEVLAERCVNCKSKKHMAYDELLGDDGEVTESGRFDMVEALEKMSPMSALLSGRTSFQDVSAVMRAVTFVRRAHVKNAFFDNPNSGVENKAAANSFEEKMFHIIRAFHVAGRCTDCGECSRVCPQHTPSPFKQRSL